MNAANEKAINDVAYEYPTPTLFVNQNGTRRQQKSSASKSGITYSQAVPVVEIVPIRLGKCHRCATILPPLPSVGTLAP